MTKDEAMRLALEALESCEFDYDNEERQVRTFDALLVNAAHRALHQALEQPDAIEAAIKAENEACAKVVEQYTGAWDDQGYALAQAIRQRGKE